MKKLNKFFAVLVALAMMATLCVSMAFAADPEVNETGHAYFTKTWATNEGTKTPAETFSFTITQVFPDAENNKNMDVVSNPVPLSADTITFAKETTGTKRSNDLVAGKTWTKTVGEGAEAKQVVVPGIYRYTVTENVREATGTEEKSGNVITDEVTDSTTGAKTTKKTTFSNKTYTMDVYVTKDGTVQGVVVKDEQGNKVTSDDKGETSANGFNFNNTYSEKVETTPTGSDPDPEKEKDPEGTKDGATAYVQKTVTADNEAMIDTDQAFSFSTTVTFPAIDSEDSYTAKVIDKDGNVLDTVTFTKPETATENKYEDTQTYALRHGDRLVFEKIDIGAKYTATETGTYEGYTKQAGGELTEGTTITAAKNGATIVNKYDKGSNLPDSGILISNLPYIALALVAIGGLVAYVVVRRRQSDEA